VLPVADHRPGYRITVEQPFHLIPLDDVLLYDFVGIGRLNTNVDSLVGHHLDNRPLFAETETVGKYHLDLLFQTIFIEKVHE